MEFCFARILCIFNKLQISLSLSLRRWQDLRKTRRSGCSIIVSIHIRRRICLPSRTSMLTDALICYVARESSHSRGYLHQIVCRPLRFPQEHASITISPMKNARRRIMSTRWWSGGSLSAERWGNICCYIWHATFCCSRQCTSVFVNSHFKTTQ